MFPTVVSFVPPYRQLVVHIVSSKLKSAPEHTGISQEVLQYMQELCRPGSIDPFLASSFFILMNCLSISTDMDIYVKDIVCHTRSPELVAFSG